MPHIHIEEVEKEIVEKFINDFPDEDNFSNSRSFLAVRAFLKEALSRYKNTVLDAAIKAGPTPEKLTRFTQEEVSYNAGFRDAVYAWEDALSALKDKGNL